MKFVVALSILFCMSGCASFWDSYSRGYEANNPEPTYEASPDPSSGSPGKTAIDNNCNERATHTPSQGTRKTAIDDDCN